jgi:putative transposase
MIAFINDHRDVYGVEPICRVLPIAPSTYYDHIAKRHHPETAAPRVQRDAILRPEIKRVFNDNHQGYGA